MSGADPAANEKAGDVALPAAGDAEAGVAAAAAAGPTDGMEPGALAHEAEHGEAEAGGTKSLLQVRAGSASAADGTGELEDEDEDGDAAEESVPAEGIPEGLLRPQRRSDEDMREDWPAPLLEPEGFSVPLAEKRELVSADIVGQRSVRLLACTWNLCGGMPLSGLGELLRPGRYHLYAVATQECGATPARSLVGASKRPWEEALQEALGPNYALVRAHALGAMHLAVFAHTGLLPFVGGVHSHAVATGVANTVGNKGGVGICLNVGATSVLFVCSHLAAHHKNVARRNADYASIERGLNLPAAARGAAGVASAASDRFDRAFWLGDLNYRVNGTRRVVDRCLELGMHSVLAHNDQLGRERAAGRAFASFREAPLHFRPTYKLDKGSLAYDSGPKRRIPSWTDRVLFKGAGVEPREYDRAEAEALRASDHLPVLCTFAVGVEVGALPEDEVHAKPQHGITQSEVCAIV